MRKYRDREWKYIEYIKYFEYIKYIEYIERITEWENKSI